MEVLKKRKAVGAKKVMAKRLKAVGKKRVGIAMVTVVPEKERTETTKVTVA
jgi:hypothetical protein